MGSVRRRATAWLAACALLAPAPAWSADLTRERVEELLAARPGFDNLSGARLMFRLGKADLAGTNLSGAKLACADFTGADATEASFKAVRLSAAKGLEAAKGLSRVGLCGAAPPSAPPDRAAAPVPAGLARTYSWPLKVQKDGWRAAQGSARVVRESGGFSGTTPFY